MTTNLILWYILVTVAAVSATEYCDMNCYVNGSVLTHIACDNNGKLGPNCPANAQVVDLNNDLRQAFLHEVNLLRDFIAGGPNSTYKPACGMATIQWDDDLASHATLQVKRCKTTFNACHTTPTIPNSGQTIAEVEYNGGKEIVDVVEEVVRGWESKSLDILTDRNVRMGCAISTWNRWKYNIDLTVYSLVCNYSTDVWAREYMYEECASPAEKCENKPVAPYHNLCAVGETYDC